MLLQPNWGDYLLADVQVLCDLEIDTAESRSTWQQVKNLLAGLLQSNAPRPTHGQKGPGKTKSAFQRWHKENTSCFL